MPEHHVTSIEQLETLYGHPSGAAVLKEIDHINAEYRAFIEAAPFFALSTCGPEGVDLLAARRRAGLRARRGREDADDPGPAQATTASIALRNIVRDPRVSLLFLIPASARRSASSAAPASRPTRPCSRASCSPARRRARSSSSTVESVYFQCSKAIIRSKLWDPSRHDRPQEPAEQRHDPSGDHQGRDGRRGIRPGVSGAVEATIY
jgi:predicted pyridoxine 5'-phosphate oxidase superfamily flavin-nucleotide-binding protein